MKSATGDPAVLNSTPDIYISSKDLAAINHIINIAPKEAQWFLQVEEIEDSNSVRVKNLYIPEQWCAGTEVESDPEMFISLYRELLAEHGPEETNNILRSMTAWCHSHHNMPCNPSGQDITQFAEQCKKAIEDQINLPQIMFIFNKKDEYYCRMWDPKFGLMYENVQFLIEEEDYDFSWIDEQAKTKFKEKKYTYNINNRHWNGYRQQGVHKRHHSNRAYASYQNPQTNLMYDNSAVDRIIAAYSSPAYQPVGGQLANGGDSAPETDWASITEAVQLLEDKEWSFEKDVKKHFKKCKTAEGKQNLVQFTQKTLGEAELVYFYSLLTETDINALLEWCHKLPVPSSKEIERIGISLYEGLSGGSYDEETYIEAMKFACLLEEASNDTNSILIEKLISYWHNNYDSGQFDSIPVSYETELNGVVVTEGPLVVGGV